MTDHNEAELALKVCEQIHSQLISEGRALPQWFLDYRASLIRLVNGESLPLPNVPDKIIAWKNGRGLH